MSRLEKRKMLGVKRAYQRMRDITQKCVTSITRKCDGARALGGMPCLFGTIFPDKHHFGAVLDAFPSIT